MAATLPPPPVRAPDGSFAWVAWQQSLYALLSTTGSVAWSLIDKAGSSIADLQSKGHNLLTGVLGTGQYHISSTEADLVTKMTSGTYTPTLTIVANLDAVTSYTAQYMRVGDVVTVSGKFDIDPTIAGALTQFRATLPIASNFSAAEQCGGTGAYSTITSRGLAVSADVANDSALFSFMCSDITNGSIFYSYSYRVI